MPDQYKLTIEEHPTYLHTKGEGPRTPENALRFLRETHAACVRLGRRDVLLEMAFTGAAFDASAIFGMVSERAPEGAKLGRIAYVESTPQQAPHGRTPCTTRCAPSSTASPPPAA